MEVCRDNGFAISFSTQIEHDRTDDTGLNSVCLKCSQGDVVCSKKFYLKYTSTQTAKWHFAR